MAIKLRCAALLGFLAATSARAATFGYDGVIDTYTVTETGTYDIAATGAAGGTSVYGAAGGQGAGVEGVFTLTAGTVLDILVGQQGFGCYGSGGGGGSFVVTVDGIALAIAGGGGGGYYYGNSAPDGSTGPSGSLFAWSAGGGGSAGHASGGGGLLGDGGDAGDDAFYGSPGRAFLNGGAGGTGGEYGANGGFGGGGGGGYYGGGGGGGYSGGDGGTYFDSGGGGGSYLDAAAASQVLFADASTGNGSVTITELSALPEPGPLPVFGAAVPALRGLRRRGAVRCRAPARMPRTARRASGGGPARRLSDAFRAIIRRPGA